MKRLVLISVAILFISMITIIILGKISPDATIPIVILGGIVIPISAILIVAGYIYKKVKGKA